METEKGVFNTINPVSNFAGRVASNFIEEIIEKEGQREHEPWYSFMKFKNLIERSQGK